MQTVHCIAAADTDASTHLCAVSNAMPCGSMHKRARAGELAALPLQTLTRQPVHAPNAQRGRNVTCLCTPAAPSAIQHAYVDNLRRLLTIPLPCYTTQWYQHTGTRQQQARQCLANAMSRPTCGTGFAAGAPCGTYTVRHAAPTDTHVHLAACKAIHRTYELAQQRHGQYLGAGSTAGPNIPVARIPVRNGSCTLGCKFPSYSPTQPQRFPAAAPLPRHQRLRWCLLCNPGIALCYTAQALPPALHPTR